MQCSKETLVRLFYNFSISFQLLFLFFYLSSISLAKFLTFLFGNPFYPRNHEEEYDYRYSDEEEQVEDFSYSNKECMDKDDFVEHVVDEGEEHSFLRTRRRTRVDESLVEETLDYQHDHLIIQDQQHVTFDTNDQLSVYSSPASDLGSSTFDYDQVIVEDLGETDTDSDYNFRANDHTIVYPTENHNEKMDTQNRKSEKSFNEENYFIFEPPKFETKKIQVEEKDIVNEEIFGDTCTVGSTSKNSSEWRSSINCGTEDPFSSSSRRSCPKWESYTVFQKYDEEMLFLDRVSAQKLQETESLRSIKVCPRSISERIVHKLSTKNNRGQSENRQNPYQELEGAYVAQICLTWEALNWNYVYFQRLRASRRQSDPGCPAYIAQQFQQFQVLLQRYVENEPYEHGRRPEVYARMRSLAPKLLQVPEYRDSDEDKRDDYLGSRISSSAFLQIMEEAITTFMDFLKADKTSPCQIIMSAFFKRNRRRGPVDPTLILLQKKVNKKKTSKVKDLRRAQKCIRKRKLKEVEEMEIVMALIDLKVVSRVLRMNDLSEEQLHWCEDKMTKVRVGDGKLQRDSSPLFFPAH
ncbi:Checkpoint serine/threonine-protein kinase BUB1 [Heracleum sosnowskyi]|uniref:Checkpoint serine/threonine-protein kinase BUB1 n=1 Tax=Heracleum sosnowskyi TaxID=360622 RepID=A0AAD8MWK8_9APIA|nr:Checkpoint serine/threonine-protein kinase BUB1 [Heracleum sosnowskyi]